MEMAVGALIGVGCFSLVVYAAIEFTLYLERKNKRK